MGIRGTTMSSTRHLAGIVLAVAAAAALAACNRAQQPAAPEPTGKVDAARLTRLADRILALYTGPFLAGDTDEAWYISPRERLRNRFVRPPLLPWLALRLRRGERSAEAPLRLVMALASVATVALTGVAGWLCAGPAVALIAALLLALQPERIVIGCHVWPDTLLALVLAALAVVWLAPLPPAATAWSAGGLALLGLLIRIDFLVVPPILALAWRTSEYIVEQRKQGAL